MSERAAYSRVYWSLVDDDKFAGIYDDDHHLAAWLRLLLIADQAHPASAHLPTNVRKTSVKALADAGLIDLLAGHRYRVHGLDAERERRRYAATSRPPTGPGRGPNGTPTVSTPEPSGSYTQGLRRDETSKDETRRDDARATTGYPDGDRDSLDVYHELTGWRPWGAFSGGVIRGLIADYTDPTVEVAMRAEHTVSGDRDTLLRRLQARLARDAERLKLERPAKPRRRHSDPYDDPAFQAERRRLAGLTVVDAEAAS